MYLDAFTTSALVDEFMDTLVGGRIQDALDVDETGIGFEIYANHRRQYLYLSADNSLPRVFIAGERLRRGRQQPTTLGLLIRRYVEGGILTHVSQPLWERVIHFHIQSHEGDFELIIEPMERRSNLLLVKDGTILDCMRRVGADENRVRVSLPAHPYIAPPPQVGKRDPLKVTLEEVSGFFMQESDPKRKTFQVLTGHLLAMSPLLAREIVYRAGGDVKQSAGQADPEAVYAALRQVIEPLGRRDWAPGIVANDGRVEAFSVYPVEHLTGWQSAESLSAAMVAFYGAPVGDEAYAAAKVPVKEVLEDARKRIGAKVASLERSLTDEGEREVLRQSGELILAYQYAIQPGQTELKALYEMDAPELVIRLDPTLTPLENAQAYFTRYNKAKRALDDVPRLLEATRMELAYLDQLAVDLEMAANWPEIGEVQQALQINGYWYGQKPHRLTHAAQSAPMRIVTRDAFVIWIGRNSRQNEIVTFKKAGGDDFWLHARDVPGAHVIIKNDGRRIPEELFERAAAIAAYYSARRSDVKVPVDVTRCKYVKKIRGAAQGMVTYRNEETRLVAPQDEKGLS